jgi:ceramide glucosyltransferase
VPAPGHAHHALLRDGLLLAEWLSAFIGTTARWRSHRLPIDTGRAPARATMEPPSWRQRSWTPRR